MNTQRVKLWHIGVTLALLLVFLLIVPVGAQATKQMVRNGDFETCNLDPWQSYSSAAIDYVSHTGSCAARVDPSCDGMNCRGDLWQFTDKDFSGWPTHGDGKQYATFSAYVYFMMSFMNQVDVEVMFCENSDCDAGSCTFSGAMLFESFSPPSDSWQELSTTVELPAGTQCARMTLYTTQDDPGFFTPAVLFDDVQVYSSTPNAVTVEGFDAQSAAWPALALGTLALGAVLVFFRKRR